MKRLKKQQIIKDIILDKTLGFDGVVKQISKFINNNYRRRKYDRVTTSKKEQWQKELDDMFDSIEW